MSQMKIFEDKIKEAYADEYKDLIMSYKGSTTVDARAFYAPYVPVTSNIFKFDPEDCYE